MSLISIEINSFYDYTKYIENSFQKELSLFEKGAEGVPAGLEDEYWEYYLDEVAQYKNEFPKIMRNSLFVSVYSFLESKIVELCVPHEDTSLQLGDMRGKGIEQAELYLKKVIGLDFPYNSKEWHYIKKLSYCVIALYIVMEMSLNLHRKIKLKMLLQIWRMYRLMNKNI